MKRILIAPLDWGLGHATRCIPVIRACQTANSEVVIGGSGDALELLRHEFPELSFVNLPGYSPRYPRKGSMIQAMIFQLPRFLSVIAREHKALQEIIKSERIDLVISDNRYGCWSRAVPSIFITHQSNIMMPKRFGWLQYFVRWVNNRMMMNFKACWIPDIPGDHSLAGELIAFGHEMRSLTREYIGSLSRFTTENSVGKKYDVVAVFSGPEPQRTVLEDIVLPQLQASGLTWLVVRGLPRDMALPSDKRIMNFLSSKELQNVIQSADLVIARSGYSTVMDLHALRKNAVFIPTPGQTEQEYLAKRLMKKGITFYMDQDHFVLKTAVDESRKYSGFTGLQANIHLQDVVNKFVRTELNDKGVEK